jgi:hypothetical protein
MYFYLTSALKRRIILELQDSFSKHPIYNKITPFIQNKYAFTERPHFGIVVKGSSANKIQLSGDNFIGTVQSYVMLAHVGQPAFPIEWIQEDIARIQANGNIFPLQSGVYYLEILTIPEDAGGYGTFAVDPLITVTSEPAFRFETGIEREVQLQQAPVKDTVRLWDNDRFLLREGRDYVVDYKTGAVELRYDHAPNASLTADYRYIGDSVGPCEFRWNQSDAKTLPGVILAFGKRANVGDKVAIVVYQDRVSTAGSSRFHLTSILLLQILRKWKSLLTLRSCTYGAIKRLLGSSKALRS